VFFLKSVGFLPVFSVGFCKHEFGATERRRTLRSKIEERIARKKGDSQQSLLDI